MGSIRYSVAFRLALICGGLVVGSVVLLCATFYWGTVTVMSRNADVRLLDIKDRLQHDADERGLISLANRIGQSLTDGVDSDTEILLLLGPDRKKIAGNLDGWSDTALPVDRLLDIQIVRNGRTSNSRILIHRFTDGALLIVGRDMKDLAAISNLIGRAVLIGGALALLLAVVGTLLFRRQIERRIGAIRLATADIESGNLDRRIYVSANPDEFGRLGADINRMLDTIQTLMEGVKHVSNTIAHNLRTPLGLIRGRLEQALNSARGEKTLSDSAQFAIEEIDNLIIVLEKLLQLAETESGTRRQPFGSVNVEELLVDLTELYDAAAEAQGAEILLSMEGDQHIHGDKDLISTMLANLLDNALKYGGHGVTIRVSVKSFEHVVEINIQDNGPGIPLDAHARVLLPFQRVDRTTKGSGLGLSIVAAITTLHRGQLRLSEANPGLCVSIGLPTVNAQRLLDTVT